MKTKMMTLAAVFCCALSSTMFTACGSDDDDNDNNNNNKVQVDEKKPVAVVKEYKFDVSDDMLAMLDITVEYYDENCKLQTEKLTQKEWIKKVKVASVPAPASGARLKAQVKDGVDVNTIGNKTSSYGYVCRSYLVNASDNEVGNSDAEGVRLLFDENVLSSLLDQENGIIMSFPKDFKTGD